MLARVIIRCVELLKFAHPCRVAFSARMLYLMLVETLDFQLMGKFAHFPDQPSTTRPSRGNISAIDWTSGTGVPQRR